MSTFNTIHDAVVALQTGKATKPEFFAFAKSRQTDTKPLLELMMTKVLTQAEVLEIIEEQKKLTARKTSGTGGVYFKVSEKGACSVYGLQPDARDPLCGAVDPPAQRRKPGQSAPVPQGQRREAQPQACQGVGP